MAEGAGSPTSSASVEPFATADRAALVEAMNVAGYAVIPDALPPDAIAVAQRSFVLGGQRGAPARHRPLASGQ
jgi:hypothetical protein